MKNHVSEMEFHAEPVNNNVVTVMACSDDLCRQLKIAVPATSGANVAQQVEDVLKRLFAKLGDAALKYKSLDDMLVALE